MERLPGVLLPDARFILPGSRLLFVVGCLAGCSPSTAPPTSSSTPSGLIFPALPAQVQEGTSLLLTVRGAELEPRLRGRSLRYHWLTKYVGEEWTWKAPWTDSPDYTFRPAKPGTYDLQVDIAEKGIEKPLIQKWLGTIEVQGALVASLTYSPLATVVPVGTQIGFTLRLKPNIPLERLEFRVWDLLPTNRVVTDWRRWPIPAFRADAARRTGLQVDVRLADAPNIIDRHWLNDFVFDAHYQSTQSNLLRELAAATFGVLDRDLEVATVADAAWIALHMLLWEHETLNPRDQVEALRTLKAVAAYSPSGELSGVATAQSGRRYELDFKERRMRDTASPVIFCLSLKDRPAYQLVFDLMGKSSREEKIAAALTYAVYSGYHYGTQSSTHYMEDLEEAAANCGDRAFLLRELLSREKIESEFVEITCSEAGHILVQAQVNGSGPLLLDPSTARIFQFDARHLGKEPLPPPVILPETYHIDYLGLERWYAPACTTRIYRKVVPGVFPLVPVIEDAPSGIASGKNQDSAGRPAPRSKQDE